VKVRTIVVGFDGSDNSRRALDVSIDLVSDDGVVHVVTAYEAPSSGEVSRLLDAMPEEFRGSFDILSGPRTHLHDATSILEERGIDHKGHFISGHAAGAILDVADEVDADMIIVGSRGLGRATRFIRGSVSTRVATHAKASFMVIHDDD